MAKTKATKIKVVCLQKFRDKHTNKIRHKGDTFSVTEERFDEILKVGKLVEKATEPKTEK